MHRWFSHSRSVFAEARRGADSCARDGRPSATTLSVPTKEDPQWPTLANLRLLPLAAGPEEGNCGEASPGASPEEGNCAGDVGPSLASPEGLSCTLRRPPS